MTNEEFIKKFGVAEFYDMSKNIYQDLQLAREYNKIGGFQINNTKKKVRLYKEDNSFIVVDFATIYMNYGKLFTIVKGKKK